MALTPEQIEEIFLDHGWHWNGKADAYIPAARAVEAEVRKDDEALIRQLVEALEGVQKHHSTTSLPLAIENFGSREACGQFGIKLWREHVPAAITAGRAWLEATP